MGAQALLVLAGLKQNQDVTTSTYPSPALGHIAL
ncbi:MAG: hypothetical protein RL143_775 [Pseudomonadota bacterium]